ncbi:MAG: hypothetical protein ACRCTJ_02225 [Brevinema sp.]
MQTLLSLLDLFKISPKSLSNTPNQNSSSNFSDQADQKAILSEQVDIDKVKFQDINLEEFKKVISFFLSQKELNKDFLEQLKEIEVFKNNQDNTKTLKNKEVQRVSHRFDGKNYSSGHGISNLAKGQSLEETSLFADEVEKLCKQGLDRRSAYVKARQNLMNMEH